MVLKSRDLSSGCDHKPGHCKPRHPIQNEFQINGALFCLSLVELVEAVIDGSIIL